MLEGITKIIIWVTCVNIGVNIEHSIKNAHIFSLKSVLFEFQKPKKKRKLNYDLCWASILSLSATDLYEDIFQCLLFIYWIG